MGFISRNKAFSSLAVDGVDGLGPVIAVAVWVSLFASDALVVVLLVLLLLLLLLVLVPAVEVVVAVGCVCLPRRRRYHTIGVYKYIIILDSVVLGEMRT